MQLADLREREKLCAEFLDNSFETTTFTHTHEGGSKTITCAGGDSLGAIDDDHTSESGGSNMNNYLYNGTTYNLAFDYDALKAAGRTMALFVDPKGNPMPADPNVLICKKGSSVHYKAIEVLGAIQKGKIPESFDNDASGVKGFEIIPLDYLANDAYYWMMDKSRMNDQMGYQFIESMSPTVDATNIVYKTKELQKSIESMFDLGFNDCARSWVGSKGTEANPTD